MKLNYNYLIITFTLLIVEIIIALYVRDAFVRPYLGDSIAVAFVYTGALSVIPSKGNFKRKMQVATAALCLSFFVEGLQATSFLQATGLEKIEFFRIVLGSSFSWIDIYAYVGGFIAVVIVEWLLYKKTQNTTT